MNSNPPRQVIPIKVEPRSGGMLWFAPDVGRWAARESNGSYYLDDSVVDQPFLESSYRWELLGWT